MRAKLARASVERFMSSASPALGLTDRNTTILSQVCAVTYNLHFHDSRLSAATTLVNIHHFMNIHWDWSMI